jgi:hypothetical protein
MMIVAQMMRKKLQHNAIQNHIRINTVCSNPSFFACERSSPVGDSLKRAIPLKLEFTTNP